MTIAKNTIKSDVFASGPSMSDLMKFGVVFAPEGDYGGSEERRDEAPEALSESDAEAAFLRNLGADEESTTPREDGDGDSETTASQEPDEKAPEVEQDAPEETPPNSASDDAVVDIKVGEETHKVAVKDLKRLFGQEAALTRRSQEVAQAREEAVTRATAAKNVLEKALERAEARFKPYAELDLLVLSKSLDEATLKQIRQDGTEAYQEVEFLKQEIARASETTRVTAQEQLKEAAQASLKAITTPDSPHYIEGWGAPLYDEIRTFAKAQGLATVDQIVDPAAIKLIRMAMLYERGRTVAKTKVQAATKPPSAPLKPGSSNPSTAADQSVEKAMERLRKTGRPEDAEAAFLARLR